MDNGGFLGKNSAVGLSLVEVMVAAGVFALIAFSLPSLVTQMGLQQKNLQQKIEMQELMTEIKQILLDKNSCEFNFIKNPINLAPISFNQATQYRLSEIARISPTGAKLLVIQAGAKYEKGSGLITVNPSTDPQRPGLLLVGKAALGSDMAGNNQAFAAEIVVNATRIGPKGEVIQLSDRLPVNLEVDKNGVISDCYTEAFAIGTDLQNDICATMSRAQGGFAYYDPKTNQCVSTCVTGTDTVATCPAGGHAVTCNVMPGYTDNAASKYQFNVTVRGGGNLQSGAPAVQPTLVGDSCQCFWGENVSPHTQCVVCCATYP